MSRISDDLVGLLVAATRDYAILTLDVAGQRRDVEPGRRALQGVRGRGDRRLSFLGLLRAGGRRCRQAGARAARSPAADGQAEDEGWRLRKDGSRFWANVVITALRDPDGTLRGYGKVTRDLTELHATEQARRDAQLLFETAFADAAIGMALVGPGGRG